jgi:environmental stress-induced protein Ves
MTISLCNALDFSPKSWRNGGGKTRELLAWPNGENWRIRISLADIDADGVFSSFPETKRWFSVVDGGGVNLRFADQNIALTTSSDPFAFDGAQPPYCSLINGSTRDLNLMVKRRAMSNSEMTVVINTADRSQDTWAAKYRISALLTTVAGHWTNGQESRHLNPYDFLCAVDHNHQTWSFIPEEPNTLIGNRANRVWWLGANASEIQT